VWATANEISTDVWVIGTSGSTAKVRTLWDDKYLYVYAEVSDKLLSKAANNNYEKESIEVYVDQNNAKTANYQPDDCQFRVNFVTSTASGAARRRSTSKARPESSPAVTSWR
jgi:endo-1,4-beta-xylanase